MHDSEKCKKNIFETRIDLVSVYFLKTFHLNVCCYEKPNPDWPLIVANNISLLITCGYRVSFSLNMWIQGLFLSQHVNSNRKRPVKISTFIATVSLKESLIWQGRVQLQQVYKQHIQFVVFIQLDFVDFRTRQ